MSKVAVAGVVVIQDGHFLAIHRPKKRDWSLPKGRVDTGESNAEAAVRECLEETGLEVCLKGALPTVPTANRDLTYYAAKVVKDHGFEANKEVDSLRWVPLPESETALTAKLEAVIVKAACMVSEEGLVLLHSPNGLKTVRKKVRKLYGEESKTASLEEALSEVRRGRVAGLKVKEGEFSSTVGKVEKALSKGKVLRLEGASVYVLGKSSVSEAF